MRSREEYQQLMKAILKKRPFFSNTDVVYRIILDDILKQVLKPSEKIPQNLFAEYLGISRTPVREALLRLEAKGYIEKLENSSYQVHVVSFKEYMDFCGYRALIESYAARLAANAMGEEELEELRSVFTAFCGACTEKNMEKVVQLDRQFHEIIVRGSHNQFLIRAYEDYVEEKQFYFTLHQNAVKQNFARLQKRHTRIFHALEENDADKAMLEMKNHLSNFYNFYA